VIENTSYELQSFILELRTDRQTDQCSVVFNAAAEF